ncbi:hypothetical protein E2C01_079610 [Portunus trituberculatus]|uniref:Uncharacterized protein n=1 Tax=Portunus trituberculatus TaxID=210409 RepID=A0A5B7IK03_PORTR|nr:hypothetical protein [Portunus trituberculatus]
MRVGHYSVDQSMISFGNEASGEWGCSVREGQRRGRGAGSDKAKGKENEEIEEERVYNIGEGNVVVKCLVSSFIIRLRDNAFSDLIIWPSKDADHDVGNEALSPSLPPSLPPSLFTLPGVPLPTCPTCVSPVSRLPLSGPRFR